MNGTEQSDSPIVPRKLANKAARAAAEPMEGSGGTKRNAELQSTVGHRAGQPCHKRRAAFSTVVSGEFCKSR
jgi:hypothetical protein